MAHMAMTIEHGLTQAEALKRIQGLLTETKKEYGNMVEDLEEEWQKNRGRFSFTAKGYAVSGAVLVTSPIINIEGELPGALGFFKKRIEKTIRKEAEKLLA